MQQQQRTTVLVVDDVALVRMLVADVLRERGFQVVEAASGEEAICLLEAERSIECVITDIFMPNAAVDGIDLVAWLTRHRPDVRAILGSGVTVDLDIGEISDAAGPILPKPYDYDELDRRLRSTRTEQGGGGPAPGANRSTTAA